MSNKFFAIVILSVLVNSCQYPVHSGTFISDEQITELKKGDLSKTSIEEKIGSPNIVPDYSKDTWYYVYRGMTRRAFFEPVVKTQRIVELNFIGDRLDSVEVLEDRHNTTIKIVKEFIKAKGTELNPMQEYVKNFGRFNKGKKKDPRR